MPISLSGSLLLTGSLTTNGTITAQTLVVQVITSSIVNFTGSNTFGSTTSNVQQMTGSLRVTGSGDHYIVGGNVGIGTTGSTSYQLEISSTSDPTLGFYRATNSLNFGLGRISWDGLNASSARTTYGRIQTEISSNVAGSHNGSLIFYTAGAGTLSERMRISGSGNVGIGTTTPGTKLEVSGAIRGGHFPISTTNSGEAWYGRASDRPLGTATFQLGGSSSTNTWFEVVDRAWTKVPFRVSGEAPDSSLIVSSSGNVGIGTATPSYKLQVRNDVGASTNLEPISLGLYNNSDGGAAIYFNNAVSGQSKISFGVESTGGGTDDTYLAFSTGQNAGLTERMRIDSSGRVLVSSLGYQPRFYAERATTNQTGYNATSTGDVVVIYNSAIENIGSHYSTSTGKFTAPVAGMYVFNYSAWVTGSAIPQVWLVVNGSRKAGTDMVYASGSVAGEIISGMNTVYLAANDTVGVHPYNGSATNATVVANTYHTWFKGYLIG